MLLDEGRQSLRQRPGEALADQPRAGLEVVAGRHGHADAAQPVAVREPAAGQLVGQSRGAVGAGELRGAPLGRTSATQPRGVGVEDVDAPEPAVARVPQQHPVAHPQRQGALEREPGDAAARVAERAVPHRDVRGTDVQLRCERGPPSPAPGPGRRRTSTTSVWCQAPGVVSTVPRADPVDVAGEVERDAGGAAHRVDVLPERLQPRGPAPSGRRRRGCRRPGPCRRAGCR